MKTNNMVEFASAQIQSLLTETINTLMEQGVFPKTDIPTFIVEIPADKSHGDFASNAAMVCAKPLRMAPRKIAETIAQAVNLENSCFDRIEIAGPGFMNFFLNASWFTEVLLQVKEAGDSYGKTEFGKGKRALVEFVSANPTGPMHVGNARGGAIGDCLASVLSWAGYETEREFYVNDAGNQIEKFATSLEVRYLQQYKEGVELPEDAYQGNDIVEHAQNFAKEFGDKYVETSAQERRKALVDFALPQNIAGLERDLKTYLITYDTWYRESTLHQNGRVTEVIEKLKELGYTYEQDGAVWFKAEQFGADKDFVLVRANGIPTYVVPDIAYHYDKLATRNFDLAIDVLGADHHGYVPRLKAALTALGAPAEKLKVVLMQMVFVMRNGQIVKQSKRSGKALTLATLLEDISIDAARFFFNLREANSHFEFDLDLAVEKSSQNPVYYVQYAHARICSLLKTLAQEGKVPDWSEDTLKLLTQTQEIELIRFISTFPSEINAAAAQLDPSKITKYAVELATLFHRFYDACSVKNAETEELKAARLALCAVTRQTIANVLSVLKITCPETM